MNEDHDFCPMAASKEDRAVREYAASSKSQKQQLSHTESMSFHIHNFHSLPHKVDESLKTPSLKAHGASWALKVYPRGRVDLQDDEEHYVSIHLERVDGFVPTVVKTKFSSTCGKTIQRMSGYFEFSQNTTWGWSFFAKREFILDPFNDCLDEDGTLVVDIDLQCCVNERSTVWYPKKKLKQTAHRIADLLLDPTKSANLVVFMVDGQRITTHRCVLEECAPVLFELVKEFNSDGDIEILDVTIPIFKTMLRYIYTGEMEVPLDFGEIRDKDDGDAPDDVVISPKALLLAADRFGVTHLKLFVESEIVARGLDKTNAADWLLVADSHCCALLKEACIGVFAKQGTAIMQTPGWSMVRESTKLLHELLVDTASNANLPIRDTTSTTSIGGVSEVTITTNLGDDNSIDCLDVASLRDRLEGVGLDIDGSREMLLRRWKCHITEQHVHYYYPSRCVYDNY